MQLFVLRPPLLAATTVLLVSVFISGFVAWTTTPPGTDAPPTDADRKLPDIFYPFGEDVGDSIGPHADDTCTNKTDIDIDFPFFNTTWRSLYVSSEGVISFGAWFDFNLPEAFPIRDWYLVAVWWADIDMTCTGNMYFRQSTDEQLLKNATEDVLNATKSRGFYFFRARWIFIATWHKVTYHECKVTNPVQSFQAVLVTDGRHSFAIFNYGTLTWAGNAQVGFNAGDGIRSEVIVGSRTENITQVVNSQDLSNVGVKGRMVYRIDDAVIRVIQHTTAPIISDDAPLFSNVMLSDPIDVKGVYFKFHCNWTANTSDDAARFEVTFLFDDREYGDVPRQTLTAVEPRLAELHERYLHEKLGKWLSCRVKSFWVKTPSVVSKPLDSNHYRLAIETEDAVYSMSVHENDPSPKRLVLRSTLPITCASANSAQGCKLELTVSVSGNGIAVRQKHPMSESPSCSYVIMSTDWKEHERLAYDSKAALEITPRVDQLNTAPRLNRIRFKVRISEKNKTVGGQTYVNPWDGYVVEPDILVYRFDSPQGVCTASGDPRISTFDGFYYSTYFLGYFIYVRSVDARIPFEVHVRHWNCSEAVVEACVCGVALREGTAILAMDMCNKDRILKLFNNSVTELPDGTDIKTTPSRRTFKIEMPSGSKAIVHYFHWGLNIELFVYGKFRTEGLCGSFDGNPRNDLVVRDNGTVMMTLFNGQAAADVVESWRLRPNESLFAGHVDVWPSANDSSDSGVFCMCNGGDKNNTCGSVATKDNNSSSTADPSTPVSMKKPRSPSTDGAGSREKSGHSRVKRDAAGQADSDDALAERTDDVDYSYDPEEFNDNRQVMIVIDWPTWNGITESEARTGCIERILDVANIGPDCLSSLASTNVTDIIVQKCVDDVQITGDFEWAGDKVVELQQMCIFDVISRNYSDVSDVNDVNETEPAAAEAGPVAELHSIVRRHLQSMKSYMCEPFDCGGRGNCRNGSCICHPGFTGFDCSVNTSAVPSIVHLLDSADCDIRMRLCQSLSMVVANVDRAKVTCKVVVVKMDNMAETFVTSGEMTSLNMLACRLPVEPLSLYTVNTKLSTLHEPGFAFDRLPLGGAVLRYAVSLSNDGERYGEGKTMRVVDSLCMTCDGEKCTQKDGTCLINGYCFIADDVNPYDSWFACQPQLGATTWTRIAHNTSFPIIVAALSSLLAVGIIGVMFALVVTVRNLKRKKLVV